MTEVVTKLVVSADGAVIDLKKFTDAMDKASAASASAVASMTEGPKSAKGISAAWEKSLSSTDPIFAAQVRRQKEVEKAFQTANLAVANGFATHDQAATQVGKVAAKYDDLIVKAQNAASANTLLGKAMSGVSGQLVAMSAGAGPVGVALASFGPAGLAAAVGIAGVERALTFAHEAANKFADDMIRVKNTAEVAGLATIEFQALADAGAKFALSEEKVGNVLTRTAALMDEARRGQGELYEMTQRLDPARAKELAQTRDLGSAIEVLAKVFDKAGDSKAKLDKLIGGKGSGGAVALLFGEVGKTGLESLTNDFKKSGDAIDKDLIEKIARLKAEIDDMAGDASRNFASIYSAKVLESQKTFVEGILELSRLAKDFTISDEMRLLLYGAATAGAFLIAGPVGAAAVGATAVVALDSKRRKADAPASFDDRYGASPSNGVPLPTGRPSAAIDRSAVEFDLNTQKARIAAMGSGASAADRLRQRERELGLALKDNVITQNDYNRALGAARQDVSLQAISARIGLLGTAASATDVATQAQIRINKANQDGAKISDIQAAVIRQAAIVQANGAKQAELAQYGLLSQTDILIQKTDEFNVTVNKLGLTEAQRAKGLLVVQRNARLAYEQSEIANSSLPGLKSLQFETQDLNKQFDQFAVGGVNTLTTGFMEIANGTKSTGDAFRDMGLSVVNSLQQIILKMLVMKAVSAILSPFGFADGGVMPGGLYETQNAAAVKFANGGAFTNTIVDRPTMFQFANGGTPGLGQMGEAGPEAIMPLSRGPDGKLGVASNGGQQPIQITYAPRIDARGADAAAVARLANVVAQDKKDFVKNVVSVVSKATGNKVL